MRRTGGASNRGRDSYTVLFGTLPPGRAASGPRQGLNWLTRCASRASADARIILQMKTERKTEMKTGTEMKEGEVRI